MALDKVTLDRLNQDIENAKDLIAYNQAVLAKQAYLLAQEEEAKKGQVATPRSAEFELDNDDEQPASSYVESTDTNKQESKQNNQLSQRERALVDKMLADIDEISGEHDQAMRLFLKPPVSPEADDALSGITSINDITDEDVVSLYNKNMNILRPQPTATLESEEEITATAPPRKAPETIVANTLRRDKEQRFMLAAALLSQNLTAEDVPFLNQKFNKFEDDVWVSIQQSMSGNNISVDRKSLVLTVLLADLATSRSGVTHKPTVFHAFDIHSQAADAGLLQTGSNLPKPQYGGKKVEEELPAQPGVVPFKPQKPGPGYNAR